MGPETDRIKHRIDVERERLDEQLYEVESRFRKATDIRSQFEAHPARAAGIAFAAGVLLGTWMRSGNYGEEAEPWETSERQRRTGKPYTERHGRAAAAAGTRAPETAEHLRQVRDMVDGIFSALIGVGAKSLRKYVADAVPGFSEEYERVEAKRGGSRRQPEAGTPPAVAGLS